jgi:C1A family cysteine protease
MDWIRVENQESVGSCVYNAVSSAMEYILRKQTGADLQLSRLYGYGRGRQLDGIPLTEDSGSCNATAMAVLTSYGLPEEHLWPYSDDAWTVEPPVGLDIDASRHKLGLWYLCPNLRTIQAAIDQDFPVTLGFECFESIMDKTNLLIGSIPFTPKEKSVGGHEVMVCGYNRNLDALLVAQSWGTNIGVRPPGGTSKGFFWLSADYVRKGYSDQVSVRTIVRG